MCPCPRLPSQMDYKGEPTPYTLYLTVLLVGVLIGSLLRGRVAHRAGAPSKPAA